MSNLIQNQYLPDYVSPPGDTLLELLEERGMSQAELAERTGRPKKTINGIIKGKVEITPETALQFERVLGTPASFWNNREKTYREWLVRHKSRQALSEYIPWMKKFPVRAMIKLGWIKEKGDQVGQMEELLVFFAIASPVQWQTIHQGTQWRQSPAFAADPAAVSAWLRQGEIQALKIRCLPFNEDRFKDALYQIRYLTTQPPEVFIDQLTDICSMAGVAVVFVPEIPGTRTSGATRWLTSQKAMIMLSLRFKTDDQLWFTFFHEAAHILLHGKKEVFLEDHDDVDEDLREKEEQANRFASNMLIPEKELLNFTPSGNHISHDDINLFAQRLGIAPGIVVGRFQHDKIIPQQHFNKLKRRFTWVIPE